MSSAFQFKQQSELSRGLSSVALFTRDRLLDAILENRKDELSFLVQDLLSSQRHTYDPNESLLGPFFCSVVLPNQSPPLWKRLSFVPERTIAGQQYFEDGEALRVVNYSELLGPSVHLSAEGIFQATVAQKKTEVLFLG
jgi:hypothetical protein